MNEFVSPYKYTTRFTIELGHEIFFLYLVVFCFVGFFFVRCLLLTSLLSFLTICFYELEIVFFYIEVTIHNKKKKKL